MRTKTTTTHVVHTHTHAHAHTHIYTERESNRERKREAKQASQVHLLFELLSPHDFPRGRALRPLLLSPVRPLMMMLTPLLVSQPSIITHVRRRPRPLPPPSPNPARPTPSPLLLALYHPSAPPQPSARFFFSPLPAATISCVGKGGAINTPSFAAVACCSAVLVVVAALSGGVLRGGGRRQYLRELVETGGHRVSRSRRQAVRLVVLVFFCVCRICGAKGYIRGFQKERTKQICQGRGWRGWRGEVMLAASWSHKLPLLELRPGTQAGAVGVCNVILTFLQYGGNGNSRLVSLIFTGFIACLRLDACSVEWSVRVSTTRMIRTCGWRNVCSRRWGVCEIIFNDPWLVACTRPKSS